MDLVMTSARSKDPCSRCSPAPNCILEPLDTPAAFLPRPTNFIGPVATGARANPWFQSSFHRRRPNRR